MSTKSKDTFCSCGASPTLSTVFKHNKEQVYFYVCKSCGTQTNHYASVDEAEAEWISFSAIPKKD